MFEIPLEPYIWAVVEVRVFPENSIKNFDFCLFADNFDPEFDYFVVQIDSVVDYDYMMSYILGDSVVTRVAVSIVVDTVVDTVVDSVVDTVVDSVVDTVVDMVVVEFVFDLSGNSCFD